MKILAGMVVTLIAGTTIGGIAALMMAPVEGKKARRELKNRWLNIKGDLDNACEKAKDAFNFFKKEVEEVKATKANAA